jgi:hypothetical protein
VRELLRGASSRADAAACRAALRPFLAMLRRGMQFSAVCQHMRIVKQLGDDALRCFAELASEEGFEVPGGWDKSVPSSAPPSSGTARLQLGSFFRKHPDDVFRDVLDMRESGMGLCTCSTILRGRGVDDALVQEFCDAVLLAESVRGGTSDSVTEVLVPSERVDSVLAALFLPPIEEETTELTPSNTWHAVACELRTGVSSVDRRPAILCDTVESSVSAYRRLARTSDAVCLTLQSCSTWERVPRASQAQVVALLAGCSAACAGLAKWLPSRNLREGCRTVCALIARARPKAPACIPLILSACASSGAVAAAGLDLMPHPLTVLLMLTPEGGPDPRGGGHLPDQFRVSVVCGGGAGSGYFPSLACGDGVLARATPWPVGTVQTSRLCSPALLGPLCEMLCGPPIPNPSKVLFEAWLPELLSCAVLPQAHCTVFSPLPSHPQESPYSILLLHGLVGGTTALDDLCPPEDWLALSAQCAERVVEAHAMTAASGAADPMPTAARICSAGVWRCRAPLVASLVASLKRSYAPIVLTAPGPALSPVAVATEHVREAPPMLQAIKALATTFGRVISDLQLEDLSSGELWDLGTLHRLIDSGFLAAEHLQRVCVMPSVAWALSVSQLCELLEASVLVARAVILVSSCVPEDSHLLSLASVVSSAVYALAVRATRSCTIGGAVGSDAVFVRCFQACDSRCGLESLGGRSPALEWLGHSCSSPVVNRLRLFVFDWLEEEEGAGPRLFQWWRLQSHAVDSDATVALFRECASRLELPCPNALAALTALPSASRVAQLIRDISWLASASLQPLPGLHSKPEQQVTRTMEPLGPSERERIWGCPLSLRWRSLDDHIVVRFSLVGDAAVARLIAHSPVFCPAGSNSADVGARRLVPEASPGGVLRLGLCDRVMGTTAGVCSLDRVQCPVLPPPEDEDDMTFIAELPRFGRQVAPSEAQYLASLAAYPSIRCRAATTFFSQRSALLIQPTLRRLFAALLFEIGPLQSPSADISPTECPIRLGAAMHTRGAPVDSPPATMLPSASGALGDCVRELGVPLCALLVEFSELCGSCVAPTPLGRGVLFSIRMFCSLTMVLLSQEEDADHGLLEEFLTTGRRLEPAIDPACDAGLSLAVQLHQSCLCGCIALLAVVLGSDERRALEGASKNAGRLLSSSGALTSAWLSENAGKVDIDACGGLFPFALEASVRTLLGTRVSHRPMELLAPLAESAARGANLLLEDAEGDWVASSDCDGVLELNGVGFEVSSLRAFRLNGSLSATLPCRLAANPLLRQVCESMETSPSLLPIRGIASASGSHHAVRVASRPFSAPLDRWTAAKLAGGALEEQTAAAWCLPLEDVACELSRPEVVVECAGGLVLLDEPATTRSWKEGWSEATCDTLGSLDALTERVPATVVSAVKHCVQGVGAWAPKRVWLRSVPTLHVEECIIQSDHPQWPALHVAYCGEDVCVSIPSEFGWMPVSVSDASRGWALPSRAEVGPVHGRAQGMLARLEPWVMRSCVSPLRRMKVVRGQKRAIPSWALMGVVPGPLLANRQFWWDTCSDPPMLMDTRDEMTITLDHGEVAVIQRSPDGVWEWLQDWSGLDADLARGCRAVALVSGAQDCIVWGQRGCSEWKMQVPSLGLEFRARGGGRWVVRDQWALVGHPGQEGAPSWLAHLPHSAALCNSLGLECIEGVKMGERQLWLPRSGVQIRREDGGLVHVPERPRFLARLSEQLSGDVALLAVPTLAPPEPVMVLRVGPLSLGAETPECACAVVMLLASQGRFSAAQSMTAQSYADSSTERRECFRVIQAHNSLLEAGPAARNSPAALAAARLALMDAVVPMHEFELPAGWNLRREMALYLDNWERMDVGGMLLPSVVERLAHKCLLLPSQAPPEWFHAPGLAKPVDVLHGRCRRLLRSDPPGECEHIPPPHAGGGFARLLSEGTMLFAERMSTPKPWPSSPRLGYERRAVYTQLGAWFTDPTSLIVPALDCAGGHARWVDSDGEASSLSWRGTDAEAGSLTLALSLGARLAYLRASAVQGTNLFDATTITVMARLCFGGGEDLPPPPLPPSHGPGSGRKGVLVLDSQVIPDSPVGRWVRQLFTKLSSATAPVWDGRPAECRVLLSKPGPTPKRADPDDWRVTERVLDLTPWLLLPVDCPWSVKEVECSLVSAPLRLCLPAEREATPIAIGDWKGWMKTIPTALERSVEGRELWKRMVLDEDSVALGAIQGLDLARLRRTIGWLQEIARRSMDKLLAVEAPSWTHRACCCVLESVRLCSERALALVIQLEAPTVGEHVEAVRDQQLRRLSELLRLSRLHEEGGRVDPLWLEVEGVLGVVSRARQVEIAREMCSKMEPGSNRCRVEQGRCGLGKSSSIAPVVACRGSEVGLSIVCAPRSLLGSAHESLRRVLSSQGVQKRIIKVEISRVRTGTPLGCRLLRGQFRDALAAGDVVVMSPESLRSLTLRFAELRGLTDLVTGRAAVPDVVRHAWHQLAGASRNAERDVVEMCGDVEACLRTVRGSCLLMDEVHLGLSPLKAELNFTMGPKEEQPMWRDRVEVFRRVLEPFYFVAGGKAGPVPFLTAEEHAQFAEALAAGVTERSVVLVPEPCLVRPEGVWPALCKALVPCVSRWIHETIADPWRWVTRLTGEMRVTASGELNEECTAQQMLKPDDSCWCSGENPERCSIQVDVGVCQIAGIQLEFVPRSTFVMRSGICMVPSMVSVSLFRDGSQMHRVGLSQREVMRALWPAVECDCIRVELSGSQRWFAVRHLALFAPPSEHSSWDIQGILEGRRTETLPRGVGQLVSIARDALDVIGPHVLTKRLGVQYGLMELVHDREESSSRRLLAVPFTGRNTPSANSEFASADAALAATLAAYAQSGLRLADSRRLLERLGQELATEAGPLDARATHCMFREWSKSTRLPPLHLLNPADGQDVTMVHNALRAHREVVFYYLRNVALPEALRVRRWRLTATGEDIASASSALVRLGFSGTPSSLLPRGIGKCHYERGSEALVARVLTGEDKCRLEELPDGWDTDQLLRLAVRVTGMRALIDAGALVAGLSNEQTARELARLSGLSHGAFADEGGRVHVVDVATGGSVWMSEAAVPALQRVTFYDQSHCVGCDVPQAAGVCAVVTVSKDTTLSEFTQAAWRMRQIETSQRLIVFVPPEVGQLVRRTCDVSGVLSPRDLFIWLCTKQARWDAIERTRLRLLRVRTLFREPFLSAHLVRDEEGSGGEEPTLVGCDEARSVCEGFLELTVTGEGDDDEGDPLLGTVWSGEDGSGASSGEGVWGRLWCVAKERLEGISPPHSAYQRQLVRWCLRAVPFLREEWEWEEMRAQLRGCDASVERGLDTEAEAERDQEQEAAVVAEPGEEDGRGVFYPGRKAEVVYWNWSAKERDWCFPAHELEGFGQDESHVASLVLPETRVMVSKNVCPRLVKSTTRGKRPQFVLRDHKGGFVCVDIAEAASWQWLLVRRRVAGKVINVAQRGSDRGMEVVHVLRGVIPRAHKEAVDRYLEGLSALQKAALLKSVQERILHRDEITEGLQPWTAQE